MDVNQTYWKQLLNLSGMELLVNAAWSGSCVTNAKEGDGYPDFYDRTGLLHVTDSTDPENPVEINPDVIIVALGTNDARASINAPIGTLEYDKILPPEDDEEVDESEILSEDNFCEAYIKGIKALMVNYPNAEIYCLSLIKNGGAYTAAIKDIANHYNLHYIECSGYEPESDDSLHPGAVGMDFIANKLSNHFTIEKTVKNEEGLELVQRFSGKFTPELEQGGISSSTGQNQDSSSENYYKRIRTVDYIPASKASIALTSVLRDHAAIVCYYDYDKKYLGYNGTFSVSLDSSIYPAGTVYVRFVIRRRLDEGNISPTDKHGFELVYDNSLSTADENALTQFDNLYKVTDQCTYTNVLNSLESDTFYLKGNGAKSNSSSWTSYIIPVTNRVKFKIRHNISSIDPTSSNPYYAVGFYGSSTVKAGTFIGGKTFLEIQNNKWYTLKDVPLGTDTIIICNRTATGDAEILLANESEISSASVSKNGTNAYYDSAGNAEFWLSLASDSTKVYSDMTWIGNKLACFEYQDGETQDPSEETAAKLDIYTFSSGVKGTSEVKTLYHKFGHCNTVDYNKANHCLILGNGSGDYTLTGDVIIIPNFDTLIDNTTAGTTLTLTSANAIVIPI